MTRTNLLALLLLASLAGCAANVASDEGADGEFDVALPGGKADAAGLTPCQEDEILAWLNELATTVDTLRGAGVHTRAARNLIAHRDGGELFDDLVEVDDVRYVGPAAMRQLGAAVAELCTGGGDDASDVQVIFSPQPYETSHLAKAVELIDAADRSLDIAMYSFRDGRILDAIERATARGLAVRVIFNSANDHRRDPEGTMSADLEDRGADVRWINKIMHHKFLLVDGAQTSLDEARDAVLMTGSGNWSSSAGSRYDENTLIVRNHPELALRFGQEFNHLWSNSRDFEWNTALTYSETMPIADADIPDAEGADAAFTSANFRSYVSSRYGNTFSVIRGENNVADRIVSIIESAETSIYVASGHLRSRPIAEALIRKAAESPDLDVRIYLDGQEFVSEWAHDNQLTELDECLAAAGSSVARTQTCYDRGFMFAYQMVLEGIDLRFKHYSYRWHYSYAAQMHHKYLIVDGRHLVTGSYNLSDNAEHNTMENIVILDGAQHPEVLAAFVTNFESMWNTGRAEGLYDELLGDVTEGTDSFPIVYDAMALEWHEVDTLKRAMRAACPDINSSSFRTSPERHFTCYP